MNCNFLIGRRTGVRHGRITRVPSEHFTPDQAAPRHEIPSLTKLRFEAGYMLSLDKDGDLLMSDGGAGSSTMGWSILRTRARQEKIVARELAAADVRHYLPLVTETRSLGGHDIIVSAPLLPGHVFVHGPVEDVSPERIIEQVEVSDQDGLNWELKNLSAALTYDVVPTPCEPVANGAKVRVASGPLRGLEGRIEATDDAAMLILQVTALQRAVRVSLDGAAVDPLQSHKRSTVGQESA